MSELIEMNRYTGLEVAVIGMAGKFPGANNILQFWENLKNGVEAITFFSEKELQEAGISPQILQNSNYVKANGILDQIDCFDAQFFGYNPKEVGVMDPQMRIFHQCAWWALEDAGYVPDYYSGQIGLFTGASSHFNWQAQLHLAGKIEEFGGYAAAHFCNKDYISLRISYKLNLKGPAVVVQSSCSTSLLAIHSAFQSILNGECEIALAGGVSIDMLKMGGYLYQEGMILSSDGHCRAFSVNAKGTVVGNGAGIVVLKRLDEAISDGDHIYGIIKGSAVNNDGVRKAGFTAPSIEGEAEVILTAQEMAEVNGEKISYIETHGTGTELGDPVEFEALQLAFDTPEKQFCAIGSVKTNIGHLDCAAGVAGFIKTILMLKHQTLVPSLHAEKPNPKIDFFNSPFYINRELKEWKSNDGRLLAGVSSFGIGGTNVHLVLESFSINQEKKQTPALQRNYHLITLSAKSDGALNQMIQNLGIHLKNSSNTNIEDVAFTLQMGRKDFSHRSSLVCQNLEEAIELLKNQKALKYTHHSKGKKSAYVFLFPGQGSQYKNMGRTLYQTESRFREEMDHCFEILKSLIPIDLKEILYPKECRGGSPCPPNIGNNCTDGSPATDPIEMDINQTAFTQPILFAFQYALSKLLMEWGITPDVMLGHSIGEYTAACLSQVFSLEEALKLVVLRGKLMQQLPGGTMLSLAVSETELSTILNSHPGVSLAAVNCSSLCTVSGPNEKVEAFASQWESNGNTFRRLYTSHAFHSEMMDPILMEFESAVKQVSLNPPQIPFISNTTGNWISDQDAINPQYWSNHLRKTVRFADGINQLLKNQNYLLIEVGPGNVLSTFVRKQMNNRSQQGVINLIPHPQENVGDDCFFHSQLGRLWMYNGPINWKKYYTKGRNQRIPLPGYPFQKTSYPIHFQRLPMNLYSESPKIKKKRPLSDWIYQSSWKRVKLAADDNISEVCWLILTSLGNDLPQSINNLLENIKRDLKKHIIIVSPGTEYVQVNRDRYIVRPSVFRDYQQLFQNIKQSGVTVDKILHLWGVSKIPVETAIEERMKDQQFFNSTLEICIYSLLNLAKAINLYDNTRSYEINVITNNIHEVMNEAVLFPERQMILAPINIIPQEYPNILCRSIDIDLGNLSQENINPLNQNQFNLGQQLLQEIGTSITETVIAYRRNNRWIRSFEPLPLPKVQSEKSRIIKQGVYIITGGLGQIGLTIAANLINIYQAKVVLTTRSDFPAEGHWDSLLNQSPLDSKKQDLLKQRILQLKTLTVQGAKILIMKADAADENAMKQVIDKTEREFGKINGMIHAAGIVNQEAFKPIEDITEEDFSLHFQAKVHGILVLEKLLRHKETDFCLLMSSISSVLGGLGYLGYSAANLFMDGFSLQLNQRSSIPWLNINWDEWNFNPKQPIQKGVGSSQLGITPEEGFNVLNRILSWGQKGQLLISTTHLQTRIDQWIKLKGLSEEKTTQENLHDKISTQQYISRPNLMNAYVEPQTESENLMAGILTNMLGYEKIGSEDNFFELGIDSIKMIQIRARLIKKGYNIELADFFTYPNIAQLSPFIKKTSSKFPIDSPQKGEELTPQELAFQNIPGHLFANLNQQYDIQDIYPLSPMQEGMLFHLLLVQENAPMYFEQLSVGLQAQLEIDKVEQSLNQLFIRHDVLRTIFIHEEVERPLQVVIKNREIDFFYNNLRNIEKETNQTKKQYINDYKMKDRARSFNLSKDVLMRVALLQLADNHFEIIWSYPHLLLDGWCVGILIEEFFEIYHRLLENKPLNMAKPRPYKTYIQWLEGHNQDKMKKYWRKYLMGFEEAVGLAKKNNSVNAKDQYQFDNITTMLEIEKVQKLQQLASLNHVTLNTVFQCIWGVLLGRYSGKEQADVVFGVVVSGRPPQLQGVEQMVGCFINTVPVRMQFNNHTTFNELIIEIQQKAVQSEPYHYCSMADIQLESSLKQNLLDHIFEFQNFPLYMHTKNTQNNAPKEEEIKTNSNSNTQNIKFTNTEIFELGNYDLNIMIVPRENILLSIGFNANIYEKEIIERAGRHSITILNQVCENSDILIGDITLMSEDERREILQKFNNNKKIPFTERRINQFIDHYAIDRGDDVALVGWEELNHAFRCYITYKKLQSLIGLYEEILKSNGIDHQALVCVYLKRSTQMLITILAIWKRGAAYIPLDLEYPQERVVQILNDSNANAIILNSPRLIPQLKEYDKGKFITYMEEDIVQSPKNSNGYTDNCRQCPEYSFNTNNLAYVMYTSGSTGKPKGAMVEHMGMMNHINAKSNDLQLTHQTVIAQNASHTFDISVWQFFTALTLGGKTIIYPDEWVNDPQRFIDWVMNDQISILELVPSYLSVLMQIIKDTPSTNPAIPLRLSYLLVTGEEVKPTVVDEWFSLYPTIKVVNAYGPTEASDDITHYILTQPPLQNRVPIGKPIQNLSIFIVDSRLQLCPVGVKGEIWVAGVGVGKGYLNRPELTSEKYLPAVNNPIIHKKSNIPRLEKIYKTGDLGSWHPNGNIEFFGRIDHQVKIRGFRIELGEIENQLLKLPIIKDAVVTAIKDKNNHSYLCAYMIRNANYRSIALPRTDQLTTTTPQGTGEKEPMGKGFIDLKASLVEHLPEYMIPTFFIELDQFPLTPNGKINRNALPKPEINTNREYIPPKNRIEKELIKIWCEVLSRNPQNQKKLENNEMNPDLISTKDRFFEIGGHSLKAMIMMSKIQSKLEVKIPLAEIFRLQTVQALAKYIQESQTLRLEKIQPTEKREYYKVSSAQNRLFLLQQMDTDSIVYNMPIWHMVSMDLQLERLQQVARKLMERHESLRTSFTLIKEMPVQRIHQAQDVNIQVELCNKEYPDINAFKDKDPKKFIENFIKDFMRTFYLHQAPLWRVGILKLSLSQCILIADMHHIISDGLSMNIFVKEAIALYKGESLPRIPLQYKDFSQWQNSQRLNIRTTLGKQKQFWLKQFTPSPSIMQLPTDFPRPKVKSYEGEAIHFSLGWKKVSALRKLALREGATLYLTIHTILNILFSKICGQNDIILGIGTAGRWGEELEGIIGMFVNTLALRNFPHPDKSFIQFLKEVKDRTLDAFENQDFPFEDLVAELLPQKDPQRNPLFDVIYAFNNMDAPPEEPTKINLKTNQDKMVDNISVVEMGTTKFDISIIVNEYPKDLIFIFEYSTVLFKRETLQYIINYFKEIISQILENHNILLGNISIASDLQDAQLNISQQEFDQFEF